MPRLNLRDLDNLLTEDLPDAGCSTLALFRCSYAHYNVQPRLLGFILLPSSGTSTPYPVQDRQQRFLSNLWRNRRSDAQDSSVLRADSVTWTPLARQKNGLS